MVDGLRVQQRIVDENASEKQNKYLSTILCNGRNDRGRGFIMMMEVTGRTGRLAAVLASGVSCSHLD